MVSAPGVSPGDDDSLPRHPPTTYIVQLLQCTTKKATMKHQDGVPCHNKCNSVTEDDNSLPTTLVYSSCCTTRKLQHYTNVATC